MNNKKTITKMITRSRSNSPERKEKDICKECESCASVVFDEMGWGHSENVYRNSMVTELQSRGYKNVAIEVVLPYFYKDTPVGSGRADIVVTTDKEILVIELKSQTPNFAKWKVQLCKYLNSYKQLLVSNKKIIKGILINFNEKGIQVDVERY